MRILSTSYKACISWNTVGKHEVKSSVIEIMLAGQFRFTDKFVKELFCVREGRIYLYWHLLNFVLMCGLFSFMKVFFFQVSVCQIFISLVRPHIISDSLTILVKVLKHFHVYYGCLLSRSRQFLKQFVSRLSTSNTVSTAVVCLFCNMSYVSRKTQDILKNERCRGFNEEKGLGTRIHKNSENKVVFPPRNFSNKVFSKL